MSAPGLFEPLTLTRGPAWANRLALAPLTNQQSHPDGRLSEQELTWLRLRAQGGFGLTMTCASHVQQGGQGFPGQLGIWSEDHLEGLSRLASALREAGSVSSVQLHHAGARSPRELVGQPVAPSEDAETGARAMSTGEVEQLVEAFADAADRAERAGFDGVELHGAHGYVLAQFLSPETNRREDRYGGSPQARARIVLEVLDAVRARCRPDFQVGLRLSPERFGLRLAEVRDVAAEVLRGGLLDYLDLSLWDVAKDPVEPEHRDRPLLDHFTDLERGATRLGVAGKVRTAPHAARLLGQGVDFVMIGRAAVLHHDFPEQARRDPDFRAVPLPVTEQHLAAEGLSPAFVDYMRSWRGFVA